MSYKNKDCLYDQYWNKQKSQKDIANECNVLESKIRYWMKKLNISRRTKSENNKIRFKTNEKLYSNKKWLKKQYIDMEQSTTQIAKKLNVGIGTINIWIKKYGIKIRSLSEGRILAEKQERIKYLFKEKNDFRKGKIPWNKGIKGLHFSPKTEFKKGSAHRHWKGEQASISQKHSWVRKHKKKKLFCECCNQNKKLELSFDHSLENYTRNSNDYKWLCKKCHIKKDKEFGIYDYRKNVVIKNEYTK